MRVFVSHRFVVLITAVLLLPLVSDASAQWGDDGTPVCIAALDQKNPMIIPDGAGGAIIAWHDNRNGGDADIYVQCVNASGDTLWTKDGVALCMATGDQEYPTIVSDGAGGAIVAWRDHRGSDYDIYAQRVDASGVILWRADGESLCTATGDQIFFGLTGVSDGAGGAIFTWWDFRTIISCDVYAQRVDASGVVQWDADGAALCTAPHSEEHLAIASDGVGGAIVTWDDYRNGSDRNIYARRVGASGDPLWAPDGVALCTAPGSQQWPTIASDGAGGAIVTWDDYRYASNRDIYAQRVDASGAVLWMADGVPVCTATGDQRYPRIVSDGAGGTVVAWQDQRSGSWDIYAARVTGSGPQWTVPICTATGFQYNVSIVLDGTGGAIITWKDERSGDADIYSQRVDASGDTLWTADGVALCTAAGEQMEPMIASDSAQGAIVAWYDRRAGEFDIYKQRVNCDGCVGDCPPLPLSPLAVVIVAVAVAALGAAAFRRRQFRGN